MESIVMKAFGIRLAFGAVTILCGAYAAAVAQRETPNSEENPWSAPVPSLVAEPIAGTGTIAANEAHQASPAASDAPAAANALAIWGGSEAGAVELVQHSEPIDPSAASGFALPPSLGAAESSHSAAAAAAPAFGIPTETAAGLEALPDATVDVPTPDWMNAPAGDAMSDAIAASGSLNPAPAAEQVPAADHASVADHGAAADHSPAANQLRALPASAPTNALRSGFAPAEMGVPTGEPARLPAANNLTDTALPRLNDTAGGPAPVDPSLPAAVLPVPGAQPFAAGATLGDFAPPAPAGGSYPDPMASSPNQGLPQLPAPTAADSRISPSQAAAPLAALPAVQRGASIPVTAASATMPQRFTEPLGAIEVDPATVYDAPGDRRLEGIQTPSIVIQKRAPAEVKVGKAAPFVIQVRNVGSVEAMDVKVHDRVPAGTRLIDASPAPVQQGDVLLWQLGTMPAGDERTVTMQLVPEAEGELGSVARVTFESAASCRTVCTRPELKVVQRAPAQVLVGQQLEIELEVSNPGTGEATGVVLQEDVPVGLEHPKGRQLDNMIGSLAPGETRRQMLRMLAVEPGVVQNLVRLTSEDGLETEHMVSIEVIAPQLAVGISGPGRRFLERQATYQVEIANSGTADATNVEIAVQLDRGFTFVSTGNQGSYDPSRHTVTWSLPNLPAGASGNVPLTLLPVEQGSRIMKAQARADLNTVASNEHSVLVEAFAELDFQITNPGGPIEVGSQTSYEIRVVNSGSATDGNVQVQLMLPTGLELISSETDSQSDGRGGVAFAPRAQLPPGGEVVHRVQVRGTVPGTHIVKAVVISDQQSVPVTKEESTLVYSDR